MAMAPVAFTIWQKFLRFDPQNPIWPNRDRFVLSIGHASMLIYSLLHLTSVKAVNPQYEVLVRTALNASISVFINGSVTSAGSIVGAS